MTRDDARLALFSWLCDYLESRAHFLKEGVAVGRKDEAALVIHSVTPYAEGDLRVAVFFGCAMNLDATGPVVSRWVSECVDAARREIPDAVAAVGELVVSCVANPMPGLTP